jgi:hypothetical protein
LGGIVKMPDVRDLEVKLEQEESVPYWDDEDQRVDADFRSVAGKMQLPKLVRYAVEEGEERKVRWDGTGGHQLPACRDGSQLLDATLKCPPNLGQPLTIALCYDDEPFRNTTVALSLHW